MPELPEVETIRKALENKIINDEVINIETQYEKNIRNVNSKELDIIIGQKIISMDRKAKHLILRFSRNYLICHLRMEGKFFVYGLDDIIQLNDKHWILKITTDKHIIIFVDFRRFATIDLFSNNIEYDSNDILSKIADEPFDIDLDFFYKKISKKNVSIKTILLDQTIISGLGNIYVDEVLFSSKIHPEKKGMTITKKQSNDIIKNSILILNLAIENKGTTIKSFKSQIDVEGKYQLLLKVHQRKNEECKVCKTLITKIVVGGRGTFFCNKCQVK